jgi:hypothetical protein
MVTVAVIKRKDPSSQNEKWGLGIQRMATSFYRLANGVSENNRYLNIRNYERRSNENLGKIGTSLTN